MRRRHLTFRIALFKFYRGPLSQNRRRGDAGPRDGSREEEGESAGAPDGEGLGEGPADKTIDCAGDDTLDDALDAALNTADEADADGESEWDGDGAIRCEGTTGLSHESVSRVCLSIARTCLGSCCVRADFAPILGPW